MKVWSCGHGHPDYIVPAGSRIHCWCGAEATEVKDTVSPVDIKAIVDSLRYKHWRFHLGTTADGLYLQVQFNAPNSETGAVELQHGRKWLLSRFMTRSELVTTAFKAIITAEEHEARENFLYRGRAVFGPHLDVEKLHEVCTTIDARAKP